VRKAEVTLHIRKLAGTNSHHIIEGAFKSIARSLAMATAVNGDKIPSTKGVL
jgi:imidazoleglycerol-phosphate dehydratase